MNKISVLIIHLVLLLSFKISSQCSTPAIVPYYQDFQSITTNGQLPACWAISNTSVCSTYTGGASGGYAAFYNSPHGTNYFYGNGIQLNVGVTYSVSLWYQTNSFSFSFLWSELSILLGSNQSAVGAATIATTPSGPNANVFTALSNTFTVSSSGVYYPMVKATSSLSSGTSYLIWDDLSITIPCTSSLNKPNVTIAASATNICSGQTPGQLVMMANGADTYTWNTGATTQTITDSPSAMSVYSVIGTNTLTGCSSTASIAIVVNPSPNVFVYANSPFICKGTSGILTAFGASSYTWSTGSQTSTTSISPSANTTYSLVGSNNFGCTAYAVQLIQVHPLPTVTVISALPSSTICNGDLDTLMASGANSYQWSFGQNVLQGSQIIVTPSLTTTYIVTGTDNNNCSSQTTFVLNVNGCTGLNHLNKSVVEIRISPNPFQDEFLLSSGSNDLKTITVTDLSGRTILSVLSKEERIIINTRYYTNGIYYVHVKSDSKTTVLKVIKN